MATLGTLAAKNRLRLRAYDNSCFRSDTVIVFVEMLPLTRNAFCHKLPLHGFTVTGSNITECLMRHRFETVSNSLRIRLVCSSIERSVTSSMSIMSIVTASSVPTVHGENSQQAV